MFKAIASHFKKVKGFFSKLTFSLGKKIKNLFAGDRSDASFDHLEQLFFESDLGAAFAMELVEKVRSEVKKHPTLTADEIIDYIRKELLEILGPAPEHPPLTHTPHVIMVIGVNGSGKTTSVAKLAKYYAKQGKKVMVAACDTYRAAALEQLETWSARVGVDIVKSQPKSDPSSVAFDAISSAKAKKIDIVILDTAGRLHTKTDLMHELEKIRRVTQKLIPDAPHETLLVLDATIGQNALDQAEVFHRFTPISGIILTKLDGTAKGGIVIAIKKQKNLPVLWVGIGEKDDDFASFDPDAFIEALLATD